MPTSSTAPSASCTNEMFANISFFGGEPLLHPRLAEMISMSVAKGMGPALITNGWLLPARLDQLAAARLKTIRID
jgi:MoaA/NifB/PqqE/SkfB family radical SAM enzyme